MHVAATRQSALVIVDVQRDLCPGGAVAVHEGDAVVERLNAYTRKFIAQGLPVALSRDWHPPDHVSFRERGGEWPPHCVEGTPGAAFHPDLLAPSGAHVVSKGTESDVEAYSAFDGTDLGAWLKGRGVDRVFVGGLATDHCVRATVLAALDEDFDAIFLQDASRGIDRSPGDEGRAIQEMVQRGAVAASLPEVMVVPAKR